MATTNIIPFAPVDTGTNLLSDAAYLAASDRTNGNQPGIASAKLNNKALRQASAIAAGVGQYLADNQATNVTDALTPAQISTMLTTSMGARWARYLASGSFTVPPGITTIYLTGCAAGGGGGGAAGNGGTATSAGGGGGGASGQVLINEPYTVTPGQVIAITMGTGGAFGSGASVAVNGAAGGAGGNLVVGSLVTLTGGGGGGGGVNSASNGSGGSGGTTGGARGMFGFDGGAGASGGMGASSPFGGGGGNGHGGAGGGNTGGTNGYGYGSGGGGGAAVYTATALGGTNGGVGANACLLIRW
ncbi:tail protein [Edwardsiella phage vB_EpM_ZHS]|nr:tail protein [Edwardsiella phage vB_EpM_ZHS]